MASKCKSMITDIKIKHVGVTFSPEKFRTPLKLSTGPIFGCDYASVRLSAENRAGQVSTGYGGIFLSDLWSFPTSAITHEEKAACMKDVTLQLASIVRSLDDYYDPFQITHIIDQEMRRVLLATAQQRNYPLDIPMLLGAVCWSPLDAAIHDAWGNAAGRSCYDMYGRDYLNQDLSLFFDEDWIGVYPDHFLKDLVPKKEVWVQHVVGVNDPLTDADLERADVPKDGLPVTLTQWIQRERVRRFKVKLPGTDTVDGAAFIRQIYRIAGEQLGKMGISASEIKLTIDPNEAFRSPDPVVELLETLKNEDPECFAAIEYLEQPTPRESTQHSLRKIGAYKPVIMDEGLDDLGQLKEVQRLGWNGIALKTCKGHSHMIAAYCWAKRNGLFVGVQDLTNSGLAFVHSANLWAHLDLSSDSLEYNSRQFAPFSLAAEKQDYEELFHVKDGKVSLYQIKNVGLY